MRPALLASTLVACASMLSCLVSSAAAQGNSPERWAVTGVSAGKTLTMRAQPAPDGKSVGTIPNNARGLANLECRNDTGKPAAQRRWCRVHYKGVEGWVAARFLKEDSEQQTAAPTPAPSAEPEPAAKPAAPAAPPTSTTPPLAPTTAVPVPIPVPAPTAAPAAPTTPAPPAPPPAAAVPQPAPATAPKVPTGSGTLAFTCTAANAIVVTVDKDGTIANQNFPAREKTRLTISVKPAAPESAGPATTATVWQMLGQQGERFEGMLVWGKAVDAREGHWRLDLQNKTLRMVQPQEGIAARFFRFDCE